MQDFEVLPSRVWEDHWGSHVWTWRSSPIWFLFIFCAAPSDLWCWWICRNLGEFKLASWLQLTTVADIGDPRAPSFFWLLDQTMRSFNLNTWVNQSCKQTRCVWHWKCQIYSLQKNFLGKFSFFFMTYSIYSIFCWNNRLLLGKAELEKAEREEEAGPAGHQDQGSGRGWCAWPWGISSLVNLLGCKSLWHIMNISWTMMK